ncbi:MAG: HD domain-containing protein [Nitrospirae bacterium]|nr:HD domain-containing protein [Nitrospirota bacterium]
MRRLFSIGVAFAGWVLLISYVSYEYLEYGGAIAKHFFSAKNPLKLFFHLLVLGLPIGSTITAFLINERMKLLEMTKESEEKLKYAAEEWRATFDAMPYGVMLIDRDFNIIRWNKYFADISGFSISHIVLKKKCYKVLHNSDKPVSGCPLLRSGLNKKTEVSEYYDSERNRHFMVHITPVFGSNGAPSSFVHSLIDITEIKEKEKKLSDSRDAFLNMLKDLDYTYKELNGLHKSLIAAFANAIDAKSHWTKGHSERVATYSLSIADEMLIDGEDLEILKTAALLHDIGKIGTYDVILDKADRLTDEEFAMIKKHPAHGEEILKPIKGLKQILPLIRGHHERLDGMGYPDGLRGEEISLLTKILCVADSFDAMTSERPYRKGLDYDTAIEELRRYAGTQFAPQVVEAFIRVLSHPQSLQPALLA